MSRSVRFTPGVLQPDVCVGAAGRKDSRVIVPLKNYDSVYDAARCSRALQKFGRLAANSLTVGAGRFFFISLHLTGAHPTKKGLEELEDM